MTTNAGSQVEPNLAGSRLVNLGNGRRVPYPEPTSVSASNAARANRKTGTKPEVELRSVLHRRGFRFRRNLPVAVGDIRVRPDIVFTRQRVAVFVDGCFWHSCPEHGVQPKRNTEYWVPKLAANVARDRRTDRQLIARGWTVVRVWEHTDAETAANDVERALAFRPETSTSIDDR